MGIADLNLPEKEQVVVRGMARKSSPRGIPQKELSIALNFTNGYTGRLLRNLKRRGVTVYNDTQRLWSLNPELNLVSR